MPRSFFMLSLLATASTVAFAADPKTAQSIAALDARIAALEADAEALRKQSAEALAALKEARAELTELKAAQQGAASAASASASASVAAAPSGPSNPNAFNPAISIILNGAYAHHSMNPDDYVRAGFPLAGEAGPGPQGFSLGESEISFAANIDDKFYGQLTLAVASDGGSDEVGVEEAYIDTTSLPDGFTLRAGRFFSNIGYLNNHHAHTDSFYDRPLAYQAFLGNQYGDDGVQLRWVAPTDLFVEVGGEALRGQNYPSGGATHDGVGTGTLFAHFGGDVGVESSWLAGISMLRTKVEGAEDGFSGDENLYLADLTWKWAPGGNTKDGGIQLRSEFFVEDRDGRYVDASDPALVQDWHGIRRGGYLEGVLRLNRKWDAGYRYDKLWADAHVPYASNFDPYRHSVELTWRNSEFSLVRLQLSHDKPQQDASDNVVSLQYQTALGAHGAHKF